MDQSRFRQALRFGCVDPFFTSLLHKSSPSAPPAPDYAGAATAQGAANVEAAKQGGIMNNPNIISPYGSQHVTFDPTTNQPTVTQSLNPQSQQIFNAQQGTRLGLADLGNQALGTARDVMGRQFQFGGPDVQTVLPDAGGINVGPRSWELEKARGGNIPINLQNQINTSGIPGLPQQGGIRGSLDTSGVASMPVNAGTTGQQAIMARLQPQIEAGDTSTAAQLANQGIQQGSEAYNNAMRVHNQANNDLRSQAALQGLGLDLSANQQGFGQALQAGEFGNQAQAQGFGQGLAANQQGFQNALQSGQFGNQAQLASFGAGLQNQQAGNQAIAQNLSQQIAAAQAQNQAQAQRFGQGLQAGQFGNTAQAQMLQQQLAQRELPLNEISALMSGSQIQNPQFQQYTGQAVAPAPTMQGAQLQGQFDLGKYNAGVGQANSFNQGLFGLGAAGIGAYPF